MKFYYSIMLTMLLGACGAEEEPTKYGDENGSGPIVSSGGGSQDEGELVSIPVTLTNPTSLGFSLAAATTFDISLEGCATGYTSTADENSTALEVYKYDRGCKAKLTGFTYGGRTYIPTLTDPFTTWDANDTATFDEAGFPGTNAVTVKVVSQLADPISGTEAIVYQFSELIKAGTSTIAESVLGDSHSMTVGSQDPPSFTIKSIAFVGVNANGGGQFDFVLECTADIGVGNACAGVNFSDTTYKLVEDTYSSTMVIGDADALFPAGESTITLPADRVAPGASGTTFGGFQTTTLDGPDQMALNPNMILILQSGDMSYQYFNIDVSTLTQN